MSMPHVLLSAAVSLDGCLDTRPGEDRLLLSSEEDFRRVDAERASSDAVLVGAGTLRADNPRLRVRSRAPHAYPLKVTVTRSGALDPAWRFWHHGGRKAVYAVGARAHARAVAAVGDLAEVYEVTEVAGDENAAWEAVLRHLRTLGVRRLMVEGGGQVHTQLLQRGLADELQLAVAPLLVGQRDAPRMLGPGTYPGGPLHRLTLVETRPVGDVVLLRYALSRRPGADGRATAADSAWLAEACRLAAACPPSRTAFSVGAIVVAADGEELARGHSREGGDPHVHAEESALAKPAGDPRLRGATVYSSLEPCGRRASRPRPCARWIIDSGVRRVVTAWREPDTFVAAAAGAELLQASGVTVVEIPRYADAAMSPNAHLLSS
ncbi:dihydrofolate reductase family protein [Streptomyces sp. NPDC045431]|uniref:dihydrofolate reductase family protein n=1 Tax=Streptomyces sp. NPDC045431 TaxID=3155613 RepID=UPI0033CE4215